MNKENIKKGRHSRTLLPGISLLYIVNQIRKIPHLIKDRKAGDPRVLRTATSGMTAYFMKNHAFTLIELLVVVLIIGILAAIALPQYNKAVARARGAEAIAMIGSVVPAIEEYMLANNAFPRSWDVLSVSGGELSKYAVDNDQLNAGNYRYILVSGRIDVGPVGKTGPSFVWQSPYASWRSYLPQRTILCAYASSNSSSESLCKTFGSTVIDEDNSTVRFVEVK